MRTCHKVTYLACLLPGLILILLVQRLEAQTHHYRRWTHSDGREQLAVFVKKSNGTVTLRTQGGREGIVSIDLLSSMDQEHLESLGDKPKLVIPPRLKDVDRAVSHAQETAAADMLVLSNARRLRHDVSFKSECDANQFHLVYECRRICYCGEWRWCWIPVWERVGGNRSGGQTPGDSGPRIQPGIGEIPSELLGLLNSDSRLELEHLLSEKRAESIELEFEVDENEIAMREQQLALLRERLDERRKLLIAINAQTDSQSAEAEASEKEHLSKQFLSEKKASEKLAFDNLEQRYSQIADDVEKARADQRSQVALSENSKEHAAQRAKSAKVNQTSKQSLLNDAKQQFSKAEGKWSDSLEKLKLAKNAHEAAEDAVTSAESAVNSAKDALDDLLNALISVAQGKINKAKKKLKDAEENLRTATSNLEKAATKLAEATGIEEAAKSAFDASKSARDTAQTTFDKAKDVAVKESQNFTKAAAELNVQKELLTLRERSVDQLRTAPDKWLDMIDRVGSEVEKTLRPAVEGLQVAADELKNAAKEVKDAGKAFDDARRRLEESKEVVAIRETAVKAREDAVAEAQRAGEQVERKLKEAKDFVEEVIEMLVNEELIPYDIDSWLNFSLNAYSGSVYGDIEFEFTGASWDSEKTKDLMKGNLALPAVRPEKLAASSVGLKVSIDDSAYFSYRDSSLSRGEPTYVASKRFVDWASDINASRLIATSIVDGGQTARNEAKQQLLLEFENIYSWLQLQGQELSDEVLSEVLLSILQGKSLSKPNVAVRVDAIKYGLNDPDFVGKSYLPKPLMDQIKGALSPHINRVTDELNKIGIAMGGNHLAYSISLQRIPADTSPDPSGDLDEVFGQGRLKSSNAAANVFGLLIDKVEDKDVKSILKELVLALVAGDMDESALFYQLMNEIGISESELSRVEETDGRIVDLSSTTIAERSTSYFQKFAFGNKGNASIERLEFNLETLELTGRIKLKHKHSWGSLVDLVPGL